MKIEKLDEIYAEINARRRAMMSQLDEVRCPLYPRKRTLIERVGMSALCQKRTFRVLFDHCVGNR
jgi:hypothetical protein